ncbi:hypothetical protein MNV84_06794 [Leishmania braziliensis]|nr:hypothetical protein MNV84_06794 [Leishmania braziliensis]
MTDRTEIASSTSEDEYTFLAFSLENTSETVERVEKQTVGKTDAIITHITSAEDSRSSTTPESESFVFTTMAVTPISPAVAMLCGSSVQKVLEACMDPVFLTASTDMNADNIAADVLSLMDAAMTVHVPALADLSCLEPFLTGYTRCERIDAVLSAARASSKLILRDDLPVPPSSTCMLSVDAFEGARLRVGFRSHTADETYSMEMLKHRLHTSECEASLHSLLHYRLGATTSQQNTRNVELSSNALCGQRAALASPVAAYQAHVELEASPLLKDVCESRSDDTCVSRRPLPVACAFPVAVGEEPAGIAICESRSMQLGPCPIDKDPLHAGSCGCAADHHRNLYTSMPRMCAPIPKPLLTIDAILTDTDFKFHEETASSGVREATSMSTTRSGSPGPTMSSSVTATTTATEKLYISMSAVPSFHKSVLNATIGATSVGDFCFPANAVRSRSLLTLCEDSAACPIDASEAMANEKLMGSAMPRLYAPVDVCAGTSCESMDGVAEPWRKGSATPLHTGMGRLPSTFLHKKGLMPAGSPPKAIGVWVPQAPCPIGSSLKPDGAPPVAGLPPTRLLMVPIPTDSVSCSSADDCRSAHELQATYQTSPCLLSGSHYRRHDPYSMTGFLACAQNRNTSSLSQVNMPNSCVSTLSAQLRHSTDAYPSSATREVKFCFQDPLIKASAWLLERRHFWQRDATYTPSSEWEGALHSNTHDDSSDEHSDAEEISCRSLLMHNAAVAATLAEPRSASANLSLRPIDADLASPAGATAAAVAPKSYAEAARRGIVVASSAVVTAADTAETQLTLSVQESCASCLSAAKRL